MFFEGGLISLLNDSPFFSTINFYAGISFFLEVAIVFFFALHPNISRQHKATILNELKVISKV